MYVVNMDRDVLHVEMVFVCLFVFLSLLILTRLWMDSRKIIVILCHWLIVFGCLLLPKLFFLKTLGTSFNNFFGVFFFLFFG